MVRFDITERVAAQRVVNNPGLRGKPLHVRAGLPSRNFRLIVGSKVQAGTGEALRRNLDRAIRTGVFKAELFTQRQAIRSGARVFPPTQRIAPQTIRALQKQGVLRPRFETRAGIPVKPKPETPAEISSRLARERRQKITFGRGVPSPGKVSAQELENVRRFFRQKGGPLAVGVTSEQLRKPFLKELDILLTSRKISSQGLDALGKRLDFVGKALDRRLRDGTATQAQVNKFNALTNQFTARVDIREGKQFREFFKVKPSPVKPKPITPRDVGTFIGDITLEEVVPQELGGRGVSFAKSAKQFSQVLVDVVKAIPRDQASQKLAAFEKRREGVISGVGSVLGGALAGFETLRQGIVFGLQEGVKLSGNAGILRKGGLKLFLPERFLQSVRNAQKLDPIIFTNPIRFIIVNDDSIVFSPRATGEFGATSFEAVLVFGVVGGKSVASIHKVGAGGRIGERILSFKLTTTAPKISSFGKVPVKSLGRLSRLVRETPQIKGSGKKITDPFPTTVKGLEAEIKAIEKAKVLRKVRERRPVTVKALQKELVELRISRKSSSILKPIPKTIRNLQKEITALKKIKVTKVRRININTLKNKLVRLREDINPATALRAELPQTQIGLLRAITRAENQLKKIARRSGAIKRARFRRNEIIGTILKLSRDAKIKIRPGSLKTIISVKKELARIQKLIKERKLIGRRPVRRRVLERTLLELRQRISPNLLKRPVPKNLNVLAREVEGTRKALGRIERVRKDFLRRPSLIRKLENEVFSLREALGVNIFTPIPRKVSDLRKTVQRLTVQVKSKQKIKFSRQRSIFRKRVLKRLLFNLREREALVRFKRKPSFFIRERINFLNKEIQVLSQKIPKTVGKKRPTQVQIQKRRLKKKKVVKKIVKGRPQFRDIVTQRLPVVDTIFLRVPISSTVGLSQIQQGIIRTNDFNVLGTSAPGVLASTRRRIGLLITPSGRVFRIKNIRISSKARLNANQKLRLENRLIKAVRSIVAVTPKVRVTPKAAARLRARERTRLRELTRQRLKQRIKRPTKRPPKKPPKIPPPIILPKPQLVSFSDITRSKGPFNVITRRAGKIVRLNKFPLSGSQALAFGGNRIDNSARASFGVVKTTGRIRKIKVPRFNPSKFRRPVGNTKLQRFFIVELSKFRIDSREEKREITAKGIRAIRRKKRKTKRRTKRRTFKKKLSSALKKAVRISRSRIIRNQRKSRRKRRVKRRRKS